MVYCGYIVAGVYALKRSDRYIVEIVKVEYNKKEG